jgi:uncharacterized membrane protein
MVLSAKFTTVEPETGALVHIFVLFSFLVGTLHYKPYMDPALNWLETFTLLMSLAVIISAILLSYDRDRNHNDTLYPVFYWINVGALYFGSIVCLCFGLYKIITCWVDMGDKVKKVRPEDDEESPENGTSIAAEFMQEVFQKKDSVGSKDSEEKRTSSKDQVASELPNDPPHPPPSKEAPSTSSTPQVEMMESPPAGANDPDPSIEAVIETPRLGKNGSDSAREDGTHVSDA